MQPKGHVSFSEAGRGWNVRWRATSQAQNPVKPPRHDFSTFLAPVRVPQCRRQGSGSGIRNRDLAAAEVVVDSSAASCCGTPSAATPGSAFSAASISTRRSSCDVLPHEFLKTQYVADGRTKEALEKFYKQFDSEQLAQVQTVAMDMWEPYISVTTQYVADAEKKISFDKFHVAGHLGDAVDQVRRAEHRRLLGEDDERLKGSRYRWLTNPENMDHERWEQFAELRDSALKTARAWAYKEHAMTLWDYKSRTWARKAWQAWYDSAIRCRLEPVKRVARMIKRHLDGIVTAVVKRVTNARAESINAGVQKLKYSARGFRNRKRFRNAIYFHLGGLDLYPAGVDR